MVISEVKLRPGMLYLVCQKIRASEHLKPSPPPGVSLQSLVHTPSSIPNPSVFVCYGAPRTPPPQPHVPSPAPLLLSRIPGVLPSGIHLLLGVMKLVSYGEAVEERPVITFWGASKKRFLSASMAIKTLRVRYLQRVSNSSPSAGHWACHTET